MTPKQILHFTRRDELRAWLQQNASAEKECWVVCSRAAEVPPGRLPYLDVVEEALCFGWIDSTCKKTGDTLLQRLSPRRRNSRWTELNKERCRRLIRLGLMTDAGYETLPKEMDANRFQVDDDILAALKEDDTVWHNFHSFPPLYRRVRIGNIQAKRNTPLFASRLKKFIDCTRRNILYGEWNDRGRLDPGRQEDI